MSGRLVLGARVRDLLWGSVCPRKLFERESSRTRGDNNGLSRCLVPRLVSSLGAKSVAHRSLFLYLSQPVGTTVLQGTAGYYGYYGTTAGYYVVPAGIMVVPEMGTIRVL